MSDDQIRDLFQGADEWSPDSDAAAGTGTGAGANPDPAAGPTGPAAPAGQGAPATTGAGPNPLPQLQLGSDVEIADVVAQTLRQDRGEVIFSEGISGTMPARTGVRSRITSCVARYIVTMVLWCPVRGRWFQ
jgi:hypothetical protein